MGAACADGWERRLNKLSKPTGACPCDTTRCEEVRQQARNFLRLSARDPWYRHFAAGVMIIQHLLFRCTIFGVEPTACTFGWSGGGLFHRSMSNGAGRLPSLQFLKNACAPRPFCGGSLCHVSMVTTRTKMPSTKCAQVAGWCRWMEVTSCITRSRSRHLKDDGT